VETTELTVQPPFSIVLLLDRESGELPDQAPTADSAIAASRSAVVIGWWHIDFSRSP
jgi:hypothetical protein